MKFYSHMAYILVVELITAHAYKGMTCNNANKIINSAAPYMQLQKDLCNVSLIEKNQGPEQ